jgi:hypothetical protein
MTSNAGLEGSLPSPSCEEVDESGKDCLSGTEDVNREGRISTLDARNVDIMQRFTIETGVAAADHCQEKRLHFTREREDVYRDLRDCANLRQREVSLSSTWQEWFAIA